MTQVDIGVRRLGGAKDGLATVPARNVAAKVWVILDNDVEKDGGRALAIRARAPGE